MALKDIKARIANRIGIADATAKVYTRRRLLTTEMDQAQMVGSDNRVHFWFVYRETTKLTDLVINENLTEQQDTLIIEGFYGVKDADSTEESFDAIIDAVIQAVNLDRRPAPGGTKLNAMVRTAGAPFIRAPFNFVEYGPSKVLCHHVEIAMQVTPAYLQ